MRNVSRMIITGIIICFALVAEAQTINVQLKISNPADVQYTAFFEVCDILGNTYSITSTNPVNWLENGISDLTLNCTVFYNVIFPFYIIKVRVNYMNQLAPLRYDEIIPVNSEDLYQQTHFLSVSF